MKKAKLFLATLMMSTILANTALSGTWTHTHETDSSINTYDNLWFYVKDNGEYAENEWIQDEDGTWYWIDNDGTLPSWPGVAADGCLYDSTGKYIDMTIDGRKYASEDLYNQLQEGMTYDQVISILGKEHEVRNTERRQIGSETYDYLQVRWYSQDAESSIRITFKNGLLHARHATWR